jgi:hypothetical protein
MSAWLAFSLGVIGGIVVMAVLYVVDEVWDFFRGWR